VCTRFRDIPQIVASLTQIVFFLTPILWKPEVLGTKIWVAKINPIFHFVELVRAPILTGAIPWQSWTVSLGVFAILALIATSMLARFGHRVAYWV
jgi:lipopolysaccharide transport system permease protein